MIFRISKSVLIGIVCFAVLGQAFVYDSGLCYLRVVRQICTCNHNSKKEVHSNTSLKGNCHDSQASVHICSCKKSKNPNELTNLIKQTFLFSHSNLYFLRPVLNHYPYQNSRFFLLPNGYKITLIKPPNLS